MIRPYLTHMKIKSSFKPLLDFLQGKGIPFAITLTLFLFEAVPAFAQEPAPSRGGSILNILLLGCIAYFLVRSFRRRSGGDDKTRPGNWSRRNDESEQSDRPAGKPMDRHEAARQAWSVLSSEKDEAPSGQPSVVKDAGFNEAEFLEGAKLFYTRFQQVVSADELQELHPFLSEDVYSEALAGIQGSPVQSPTEVMLLNARLMEMKSEGGKTFSSVFYDGQLRKGAESNQPVQARAVWEFSRDDSVENGLWILEKINKVEQ